MSEGLDLYGRYNNVTNWSQVNAVKDFAWIKLTDGTTRLNGLGIPYDYGYVGQARAAGLPVGGYHYAQFGDPIAQANFFIDRCEALGAIDVAPMLDLESPFVANRTAIDFAIAFCQRVIARGHKPALYSSDSMLKTVRAPFKAAVPSAYVVVARYGGSPTVPYDTWQFTSSGSCSGVVGRVDLDTGTYPRNVRPSHIEDWMEMASKEEITAAVADGTLAALKAFFWYRYDDNRNTIDDIKQQTGSLLGLQGQMDKLIESVGGSPAQATPYEASRSLTPDHHPEESVATEQPEA